MLYFGLIFQILELLRWKIWSLQSIYITSWFGFLLLINLYLEFALPIDFDSLYIAFDSPL